MRVNRLQAFVVVLMLALACLRAHAQPAIPVNPPLPDRELVIATREVPPFAIKRKDGSWHGISIALWHRIAERLHLRYRFAEQKTNQAILDGVAKGTFDAGIAAITITAERERIVDFTLPYYTAGLGVAVSTGEPRWRAIFRTLFSFGFLQAVSILLGLAMCIGFRDLAAGTAPDRAFQRRRAGPGHRRLVVRDRHDAGRRWRTRTGDAAGPSRRDRLDDRLGDCGGGVHGRCDLGFDAARDAGDRARHQRPAARPRRRGGEFTDGHLPRPRAHLTPDVSRPRSTP